MEHQPQEKMGQPQPSMGGSQPVNAYAQAKLPNKWTFGLFDCFAPFDLCFLTCCCPCYVFGKTHAREAGEQDPSGFNGMCCAWIALAYCGVAPILQCIERGNFKEKYGMESNCLGNFGAACCCHCCALIQQEKESILRNTGMDPKTNTPYQPVGGMNYA